MKRFVRRLTMLGIVAITSMWLTACATRTIGHVLADPERYSNKEVKLRGEVERSYSVLGRGAYELRDHTGTLWVISDRGVPREGTRVEVKGTIRDGFDVGSIFPAGRRVGVVMLESSHKAKY